MEMFLIRCENPLDMEGHADTIAVFEEEELAELTAAALNAKDEEMARESFGERWQSFALHYSVQKMTVSYSIREVVEETYNECR